MSVSESVVSGGLGDWFVSASTCRETSKLLHTSSRPPPPPPPGASGAAGASSAPRRRENVFAASYDRLLERNATAPAFVVCNATLELGGAPFRACARAVDARARELPRINSSPLPAAIDVVRLARAAEGVRDSLDAAAGARCERRRAKLSPFEPAVVLVAQALPQTCGHFGSLFDAEQALW